MATNFPTTLDTTSNLPDVTSTEYQNVAPGHASIHSTANDAIRAIEALIGVNGATDTTSLQGQFYNLANHLTAPTTIPVAFGAWQTNSIGRTMRVMAKVNMNPSTAAAASITIALSTDGGVTSTDVAFDNTPLNTPSIVRTFRITVPPGWSFRISQVLCSFASGATSQIYY